MCIITIIVVKKGGVTQFAANDNTVAKWVMNRPYQTKFAESLMDISGLSTTTSNPRKCLRSSEILKSNTMVEKIMICITYAIHQSLSAGS